jgi:hypothetical protein
MERMYTATVELRKPDRTLLRKAECSCGRLGPLIREIKDIAPETKTGEWPKWKYISIQITRTRNIAN